MFEPLRVKVVVDAPAHSGLHGPLDYLSERALSAGTLVRVPLAGDMWPASSGTVCAMTAPAGVELRPISAVLEALPALPQAWCALVEFAARYYQRSIGEVALSVLPPELRQLDNRQLADRIAKLPATLKAAGRTCAGPSRPALTCRAGGRCRRARFDVRTGRGIGRGAARCHRKRQDRGLPARRRTSARRRTAGARARARDQPDAAARSALRRALRRAAHRLAAQRADARAAPAPLARRAPGHRRSGARHAARGVCAAAAARAHRRRRGARPVVQAAGGRALLGARPRGLPRAATRACRSCSAPRRRRSKAGTARSRAAIACSRCRNASAKARCRAYGWST